MFYSTKAENSKLVSTLSDIVEIIKLECRPVEASPSMSFFKAAKHSLRFYFWSLVQFCTNSFIYVVNPNIRKEWIGKASTKLD